MDHGVTEKRGNDAAGKENSDGDVIAPNVSNSVVLGEVLNENGRSDVEKQKIQQGDAHFHRLGWKRLTVVLIVEAIALGSLGLPSAFATLGMVAGVILCISIGLIAIYACYIIGQVSLKYPGVAHYADIGRLMWGGFGYNLFSVIFISQLTLVCRIALPHWHNRLQQHHAKRRLLCCLWDRISYHPIASCHTTFVCRGCYFGLH